MITLIITVSIGVVARYFFRLPFDWTEELVTMCFVWISFMAAAVAAARHKLTVVDFFINKTSPLAQKIIGVISDLLILMFVVMLFIGSFFLMPRMAGHVSVALNVPRTIYYVPLFLASILIFFVYLENLILKLRDFSGKNKTEASL
jgi:TRAP-type C4-dicarboxylate transport system permease small subunit